MRFEEAPNKKNSPKGESKGRMSIGFYKNLEDATEKDILALTDNTLSECEIMHKYFNTNSPSEIKRVLLYTAIKDLGLLREE